MVEIVILGVSFVSLSLELRIFSLVLITGCSETLDYQQGWDRMAGISVVL